MSRIKPILVELMYLRAQTRHVHIDTCAPGHGYVDTNRKHVDYMHVLLIADALLFVILRKGETPCPILLLCCILSTGNIICL